jgi:phytoene/squalene synthetase
MKDLFNDVSFETSKITTQKYSTSFSLGIRFFRKDIRNPIYGIYGFVRFADEIVDSFSGYNQRELFYKFKLDTFEAIEQGISLNPILNSFQEVVNRYHIDRETIDQFLYSMEIDLYKNRYDSSGYKQYITGSAEVVGLMCLRVFCNGNDQLYNSLKEYAESLGSAYQKINFLRDLSHDYKELGRVYFPNLDITSFDDEAKFKIIMDIENDFKNGFRGIMKLPKNARFGVYLSYIYFFSLLQKIRFQPSAIILKERVRIGNSSKVMLLLKSYLKNKLNLIEWQN